MSGRNTRILIRSGKDPLQVISPENTLEQSVPGRNLGNLLFSTSAHKLLTVSGATVDSMGLGTAKLDPARISERYDVLVLPLANALRPDFEPSLRSYTALVEKLNIPVVVLGIGAQSSIDYDLDRLQPIREATASFMRAVLDRSASVGVRGEFTQQFLQGLGFNDVKIIGCPSMFIDGPTLQVTKRLASLAPSSAIAMNASAVLEMGEIVTRNAVRYPGSIYVGQSLNDLEVLLWSEALETAVKTSSFPKHTSHLLYRENRVRAYVDPWTWIDAMREFDFSFGARIHGNIAALLAGTPAVVLAHDSRTLELARYHEIPYRLLSGLGADVDAATLYEEADFTSFNKRHAERFDVLSQFLGENGLVHIFDDNDALAAYNERVATTAFPPPVQAASHATAADLIARIRWLRGNHSRRLAAVTERLAALETQRGKVGPAPRRRRLIRRMAAGIGR